MKTVRQFENTEPEYNNGSRDADLDPPSFPYVGLGIISCKLGVGAKVGYLWLLVMIMPGGLESIL